MIWIAKGSEDAGADHQADDDDNDDYDIEVPPARLVRHRAERESDDGEGNDHPVRPAEQRNEGENGQNQGDCADDERSDIEHGDGSRTPPPMRQEPFGSSMEDRKSTRLNSSH